jgi:hypothetical protein
MGRVPHDSARNESRIPSACIGSRALFHGARHPDRPPRATLTSIVVRATAAGDACMIRSSASHAGEYARAAVTALGMRRKCVRHTRTGPLQLRTKFFRPARASATCFKTGFATNKASFFRMFRHLRRNPAL